MAETTETNQSLWLLPASPAMWAVHFLLSYITVSVWCAKVAGAQGALLSARTLIGAYTAAALIGIGAIFWIGYRKWAHEGDTGPTDSDTPEARHRFLGFATVLLSGLSALATLYVTLAIVFIKTCD